MKLWGSLFVPHDSRGRESRTLFFVSVTMGFLWVAIGLVCWKFATQPVDINAFATAIFTLCSTISLVIGIWIGREWVRK